MFRRTKVGGKKFKDLVIRLKQKGCVHYRLFDLVLVAKTASKFGYIIERIGFYNPNIAERFLTYDSTRISFWTRRGAVVHPKIKALIAKSLYN